MADDPAGVKAGLSWLNDRPEVRKIFAAFQVDSVETHYGLAGKGAQLAREVIITPR